MNIHRQKVLVFFPIILLVLLTATRLYCKPVEPDQKDEAQKSSIANILSNDPNNGFEYKIENRRDPFKPFLVEEKKSTVDMNEIVDFEGELSGMQLFEPGQLTLVAIVKSTQEQFAMVQDFTGKGYIITSGMKIGKRGVITDIVPNRVIIEETAYTRAGKKLTNEIVMNLKQEGEEQ